MLKPLDFVSCSPRTALFLRAVLGDLIARPALLRGPEDVAAVFSRLGAASADRSILRDGIEVFLAQHVSVASLQAAAEAAGAGGGGGGAEGAAAPPRPADLALRLKAAKRALASVRAADEGDVFGGST